MSEPGAVVSASSEGESLVIAFRGRLDAESAGLIWGRSVALAHEGGSSPLIVDASGLDYCDTSGAALLLVLRELQHTSGASFTLRGLRDEFSELLALINPARETAEAHEPPPGWIERLGRAVVDQLLDLRALVVFTGQLTLELIGALRRPRSIRGKDLLLTAENAGIGAMPIILLVGFLLGLILSFQSAIPMRRFGAQIFVADLLGLSLLRELGPLMTGILLAARSGSAFAAEIGTMKVNEEIDALTTMGLDPVRFLVIPRMLAAMLVVPVLTMLMNIAGLIGGAIVMLSLGFPLVTYVNRVSAAVTVGDFAGGLFKAMVFGLLVAAIGCMRGLQSGSGAGAVGASTTSSVVSGIVLIAVADGLFAVVFFVLGW